MLRGEFGKLPAGTTLERIFRAPGAVARMGQIEDNQAVRLYSREDSKGLKQGGWEDSRGLKQGGWVTALAFRVRKSRCGQIVTPTRSRATYRVVRARCAATACLAALPPLPLGTSRIHLPCRYHRRFLSRRRSLRRMAPSLLVGCAPWPLACCCVAGAIACRRCRSARNG